jgi:broad specificity phosphatase PhoE
MDRRRTALDGAERRRVYLFRHGAVDYFDDKGNVVDDPDAVSLNSRGREETDAMCALFADVAIDRAICSGLERTRETAARVLAGRDIEVTTEPGLEEIRPSMDRQADPDLYRDIAYSHWRAVQPDASFLGGERYADFFERVSGTMQRLVAADDWHNLAVFGHGVTNAAIIGWVTGLELAAFGVIDQATGCLNIIDFDMDRERRVVRKIVRGLNITAHDPAKALRHSADMEALARQFSKRPPSGR